MKRKSKKYSFDTWYNASTNEGRKGIDSFVGRFYRSNALLTDPERDYDIYRRGGPLSGVIDKLAGDLTRTGHKVYVKSKEVNLADILKLVPNMSVDKWHNLLHKAAINGFASGAGSWVIISDSNSSARLEHVADTENRIVSTEKLKNTNLKNIFGISAVGLEPTKVSDEVETLGEVEAFRVRNDSVLGKTKWYSDDISASRVFSFTPYPVDDTLYLTDLIIGDSLIARALKMLSRLIDAESNVFRILRNFGIKTLSVINKEIKEANDPTVVDQRMDQIVVSLSALGILFLNEGESFAMHSPAIAGIKDILDHIKTMLAMELNIPRIVLYGEDAAGMFPDGQSPRDAYHNTIYATFRSGFGDPLCKTYAYLLGVAPSDVQVVINPLQELSKKDIANIELVNAQAQLMRSQATVPTERNNIKVKEIGSAENTGLNAFGELSATSSFSKDENDKALFVGVFLDNTANPAIMQLRELVKTMLGATLVDDLHVTIFYKKSPAIYDADIAYLAVTTYLNEWSLYAVAKKLKVFYSVEHNKYAIVLTLESSGLEGLNNSLLTSITDGSTFSHNYVPHITLGYVDALELKTYVNLLNTVDSLELPSNIRYSSVKIMIGSEVKYESTYT